MGSGLSINNPAIVAAFRSALLKQGLVVLLLLALVAVAWNLLRGAQLRRAQSAAPGQLSSRPLGSPEPAARRLLRVGFGALWVIDGLLQAQAAMPLGLVPRVVQPTASSSASWVQHLVNVGTTVWAYHPVSAAAAAVWIQVGIGGWLLAARQGHWSRLAGVASVGWGFMVWVFGESFGGLFAPGPTWLFGAPGAVLFYCSAGALVALPEGAWSSPRLGRAVVRVMGVFLVGMALLQAWPGRGFWQGRGHRSAPGALVGMVQQMAKTPQPHVTASLVAAFGRFDAAHGWAVNFFVVVALAAVGVMFISARPQLVRVGVVIGGALCLADWALVQDLGFLGGVGTDPNSMVPTALVFVAGYLALTRPVTVYDGTVVPIAVPAPSSSWRASLTADPTYAFRSIAAMGAIGVALLGVVPMAGDALNGYADPVIAEALDGAPQAVNAAAAPFKLVDQYGQSVTLSSLRGKTVVLTFLDDTCTTDCPVIAHELRTVDGYLGADSRRVEMVAINANPSYITPDYLAAFDKEEGLQHLANWLYLTGTLRQLRQVWGAYGESIIYLPGGAMVGHSEYAWVIDNTGRTRQILDTNPGPASSPTEASFSVVLSETVRTVLRAEGSRR